MTLILFVLDRVSTGPPSKCLSFFHMTFRFFSTVPQSWEIRHFWGFLNMTVYSYGFPRFILVKSTNMSFSCHRDLNIHFMISKCIALNWLHQKKRKTYTYYAIKMHRSSSRAQKSSSVNCSKILFLKAGSLVKRITSLQKRISEWLIDELFWALDDDLCIFMAWYVYIFRSIRCIQSKAENFDIIKGIFRSLWQEKDIFVDIIEMKRA